MRSLLPFAPQAPRGGSCRVSGTSAAQLKLHAAAGLHHTLQGRRCRSITGLVGAGCSASAAAQGPSSPRSPSSPSSPRSPATAFFPPGRSWLRWLLGLAVVAGLVTAGLLSRTWMQQGGVSTQSGAVPVIKPSPAPSAAAATASSSLPKGLLVPAANVLGQQLGQQLGQHLGGQLRNGMREAAATLAGGIMVTALLICTTWLMVVFTNRRRDVGSNSHN